MTGSKPMRTSIILALFLRGFVTLAELFGRAEASAANATGENARGSDSPHGTGCLCPALSRRRTRRRPAIRLRPDLYGPPQQPHHRRRGCLSPFLRRLERL